MNIAINTGKLLEALFLLLVYVIRTFKKKVRKLFHIIKRKNNRILRFVLVASAAMIMVITLFMINTNKATAKTINGSANEYKYFTSITIEPGDTLWNIASNYCNSNDNGSINAYIDEVCNINRIDKDTIKVGQKIIIPYYSDELK